MAGADQSGRGALCGVDPRDVGDVDLGDFTDWRAAWRERGILGRGHDRAVLRSGDFTAFILGRAIWRKRQGPVARS